MNKLTFEENQNYIISQTLRETIGGTPSSNVLPLDPTINDLKKYSRINLKKHRNLRKFLKEPSRYIRKEIALEFSCKVMGRIMSEPIRRSLEYASFGRQLLMVEELPQGAYARYESDIKKTFEVAVKGTLLTDQPNLNGNVYSRECLEQIANTYSNTTMIDGKLEVKFEVKPNDSI